MRIDFLAIVAVVLTQTVVSADEFTAWIFQVEGNKVSFVKGDKTSKKKGAPKSNPITLPFAEKGLVLQGNFNDATQKFEGAIVESGLEYPLLKSLKPLGKKGEGMRYHLTQIVTNDENKITEIRLKDDVVAKIKKEGKGLVITQLIFGGFYGGDDEGPPRPNAAADNIKVVKGWLNPETRKFEGKEVEGGLNNYIFKSTVRGRVTFDGEGRVALIRVFDLSKIEKKK